MSTQAQTKTVFLGGSCGTSRWREKMIPLLTIGYFNPDLGPGKYDAAAQAEEQKQRANCNLFIYVISPKTDAFLSIAEAVDDSNKRPDQTVFVVLNEEDGATFNEQQVKHLRLVSKMIDMNDATCLSTLEEAAEYINSKE